jgi:hypothetical protein
LVKVIGLYLFNWMIEIFLILDNLKATLDRSILENICGLFEIIILILPDKDSGHPFEGINEWEKEIVDKVLMMYGVEIVQRSHQRNQYLSELILAVGPDASRLEKVYEQPHRLVFVLHQQSSRTLQ